MSIYDDEPEFQKEWEQAVEDGETNLSLNDFNDVLCTEQYGLCADEADSGDN